MRNVWVNGTFDILHIGHISLLRYAKSLGDKLIVGIDSDTRVKSLKGDLRPINTDINRVTLLESIKYVDEVHIFNTDDELVSLIKEHKPELMVIGSDYKNKNIIGSEFIKKIVYYTRIDDHSTSDMIEKLKKNVTRTTHY